MEGEFLITFAIKKVQITGDDQNADKLTVQVYLGDGTSFSLKQSSCDDFGRQILFKFRVDCDYAEKVAENLPARLVVFSGDRKIGEVQPSWLDQFKTCGVEANFDCEVLRDLALGTVDDNVVGELSLYISLTKVEEPGSESFDFDRYGGDLEAEDVFYDLDDVDSHRRPDTAHAHDKDYFIIKDRLINPDSIACKHGNADCPVAQLVKDELRRITQQVRKGWI